MLFGQFVGDWEHDSIITRPDGSKLAEAKDGGPMYRWIFSQITPDSFPISTVGPVSTEGELRYLSFMIIHDR